MKTLKRTLSVILLAAMIFACNLFPVTALGENEYPELIITEIGVDQFGDTNNANNINKSYTGSGDPYEFIEIYNNSDKTLNVYDYMLAYQGASSTNPDYFEKSIQEYTPFFPGSDWWDANYTVYDSAWKDSSVARPVNPSYINGKIAPGETFVAWIYSSFSHSYHCTIKDFREFWNVEDSVKIFLIDGNEGGNKMNFSLKNATTGSYIVMKSSERFPKRRSADETYDCERTNTHHNYTDETYETLDEVINFAVVDYRSEPLISYNSSNGNGNAETNFTLSYLPKTDSSAYTNGYTSASFATFKRSHMEKINSYGEATVGKLNAAQSAALAKTVTSTVRTQASVPLTLTNDNLRPALIITEISSDQYGGNANNINAAYKASPNSDPFECLEIYNNSTTVQNIYDYMIAYQGSSATGVSTYFERAVQEYTPLFPGADWIDAPFTAYDSLWTSTNVSRPVNPSYNEGTIAPGEVFVIWCYMSDSFKVSATIEDFRAFWSIPDNVKVFLLDCNSERDKNFNIKNSATGEYIIMRESERFPARRSDDATYYTEGDRADFYYYDKVFSDLPEIVSWAVVDYGNYDPLYTFRANNGEGSSSTNYTMCYSPYNGEEIFTNGFLTVTFATQKRVHLTDVTKTSHIGTLTAEQKAAIAKAVTAK